jgi:type IV pilus assembly protein PilA
MSTHRTRANKGFSLVELLAVVLILAVLAAVAVPLYIGSRKTAAARACKANIAIVASAESAYALRNGQYATTTATLVGQPEGLSSDLYCPLGDIGSGKAYIITDTATGTTATTTPKAKIYIRCPNDATHHTDLSGSALTDWERDMAAVPTDSLP